MTRHNLFAADIIPGDHYFDDETPRYGANVTHVENLGSVVSIVAVDFNHVYRRTLFPEQVVHIGRGRI